MIGIDEMQDHIREANPVPDPQQLDPDELARFLAMADHGKSSWQPHRELLSEVDLQPRRLRERAKGGRGGSRSWGGRRHGLAVASQVAVLVLAVGAALILLTRDNRSDSTPPAVAESPLVDSRIRSTIQLTADPDSPVVPMSTVVGDLEFMTMRYEPIGFHLNSPIDVTPYGLVAAEHGRLWWSADFLSWNSVAPSVQTIDLVTVDGDDVIVHGRGVSMRFAWDGAAWSEVARLEVDGLEGSGAEGLEEMVFGAEGAVAVAGSTFFYSPDGSVFVPAAQGPSPDRIAVRGNCPDRIHPFFAGMRILLTESGFVTLTSYPEADREGLLCGPLLWTSADGNRWELFSAESPFGADAVVTGVAARNGRFVAIGATPAVDAALWVSDDGLDWEMKALEFGGIDGVAAGDLGWVVTGVSPGYDEQTMSFSRNGDFWDGPYSRPVGFGSAYVPVRLTVGPDFVLNMDAPALGRLAD